MANPVRISEPASLSLHAAALLARREGERISNQDIATALHVSEHHLAKVMQQLVRVGIAKSTRGPRGGFELVRSPEEITLLQLFEAVEAPWMMLNAFWENVSAMAAIAWSANLSIRCTSTFASISPPQHWLAWHKDSR